MLYINVNLLLQSLTQEMTDYCVGCMKSYVSPRMEHEILGASDYVYTHSVLTIEQQHSTLLYSHLFLLLFVAVLYVTVNAEVSGRGARGRPRFGWMDGVKRAIRDRGMDVREARERARDRNEWRAVVTQF